MPFGPIGKEEYMRENIDVYSLCVECLSFSIFTPWQIYGVCEDSLDGLTMTHLSDPLILIINRMNCRDDEHLLYNNTN